MSELIETSEINLTKAYTQSPQYEAVKKNTEQNFRVPSLKASTSDTYCCSIAKSRLRESKLQDVPSQEQLANQGGSMKDEELESNYFKSAQWFALISLPIYSC